GTDSVTWTVSAPLGTSTRTLLSYITVTDQLRITSIRTSGSDVLVSFTSSASQYYRLEYTDSLSPPNWLTAVDFVPGTGNIVTAVHVGGAGQPHRFYRVRLLTGADVLPVANFTAGPTSGQLPLTVTFTDTSSGYVTNRFWDFGDGSTTNTGFGNVTHTYTIPGTNTVKLIATGPAGSDTRIRANYIVAGGQPIITSIQTSGTNVLISFTS